MSGYSKTPLAKKLGIKAGFTILLVNQPDYYLTLFDEFPEVCEASSEDREVDFIHYFTKSASELDNAIKALKSQLAKTGILWVSWPKKAAKINTDLDGNIVRKLGLDSGLVDVKVCAVDDIWSGLKFMYRIKDRC